MNVLDDVSLVTFSVNPHEMACELVRDGSGDEGICITSMILWRQTLIFGDLHMNVWFWAVK